MVKEKIYFEFERLEFWTYYIVYNERLHFQEKLYNNIFSNRFIFEFIEHFIQYKTSVNYVVSDIITDPIINTLSYIFGMHINKFVKRK